MSDRVRWEKGQALSGIPNGHNEFRNTSRDLLPLPFIEEEVGVSRSLSRSCQRRIQRRQHKQHGVNQVVSSLNRMYSCGEESEPRLQLSRGQDSSLEFIQACVQELGGPGDLGGSGALSALRVSGEYGEQPSSSTLASYDPALVSLPSGEVSPCDLAKLWGDGGQREVRTFIDEQLRPVNEAVQELQFSGPDRVYSDPKFRSHRCYVDFINRLNKLGLLDFSIEAPVEEVGLFFVKKKANKQRMILDCRRSNQWFKPPAHTNLTTGESLRRIELEPGQKLYVCNADLANAFYTLSMPMELRKYFGLRGVVAGRLGIDQIGDVAVGRRQVVYPRVAVLPMGWSWALHWCQQVHERIAERSGLRKSERLQDFLAAPAGGFWHIQYVDNLHVLGVDKQEVESRFWRTVQALKQSGLTVHEEETCDSGAKVLGWEYEVGGSFRPTKERVWRIRLATAELLKHGRMTGKQLERLVGHITFVSLGKREMLSIFGECYTFMQRHYQDMAPVWKSVRRELETWCHLSPLIVQNLGSPWCTEVCAVDASEWGLGVVTSEMDSQQVRELGKYNERWRFKSEATSLARNMVIEEENERQMSLIENGEMPQDEPSAASFEIVPFEAVTRKWKMVGRYKWKRVDGMPVLEARSTCYGVRHLLRKQSNHGKRFLILTDSMTAACAFSKGRAHTAKLRGVVRRTAAMLLATGSSLSLRWIPSEWNPADGPSRGACEPSLPKQISDGDPSTVGSSSLMARAREEANQDGITGNSDPEGVQGAREACDLGYRDGGEEGQVKEVETIKEESEAAPDEAWVAFAQSFVNQTSNSGKIPTSSQQFSGVVQKELSKVGHRQGAGWQSHGLSPGEVLRGGGPCPCQLHTGSGGLLPAGDERSYSIAFDPSKHERVEKLMPTSKQDATSLRGGDFAGRDCSRERAGPSGFGFDAQFLPLSATVRVQQAEGLRSGEACEESRKDIQVVGGFAEPKRARHTIENPSVGRGLVAGPSISAVPRSGFGSTPSTRQQTKSRKSLHCDRFGDQRVPEVRALGLQPLGAPHLYRLRHGGASHEVASHLRCLRAVQLRGRWQALKSVKNYEKGSRLSQLFGMLDREVQKRCLLAKKKITTIFQKQL